MKLNKEKLEFLKSSKGYKAGEPALVAFDTLIELIETKDTALDTVDSLIEENRLLREQIKKERSFTAQRERDYLFALKELEESLDKANTRASTFLAADAQRKIKAKREREELEKRKTFSKTDLMLGAYYE